MTDTARKDGGPAFPRTVQAWNGNLTPVDGMTLRDWFAGQALAGLSGMTVSDGTDFLDPLGVRSAAQWAYAMADAMLEARGR